MLPGSRSLPVPVWTAERYGDRAFQLFYQDQIYPLVAGIEKNRKKGVLARARRRRIALLGYLAAALWAVAAFGILELEWELAFFGTVILVGSVVYWVGGPGRRYASDIRNDVFPVIFSFYGDSFRYLPSEMNPTEMGHLKSTGVLPKYDKCKLDDHVSGVYKGMAIELTEARLSVTRNKRDECVFKGLILTLQMKRGFKGRVVVRRASSALRRIFGAAPARLSPVDLDDPVCGKMFDAFASDRSASRALLTPHFLTCLQQLSDRFDGIVECGISENRLVALLPSDKDYFAVRSDLDTPATLHKEIEAIRSEMALIFELVDLLQPGETVAA